jgi:hypothetical protein
VDQARDARPGTGGSPGPLTFARTGAKPGGACRRHSQRAGWSDVESIRTPEPRGRWVPAILATAPEFDRWNHGMVGGWVYRLTPAAVETTGVVRSECDP